MGWPSVYSRWSLPRWLLMPIAYLCLFITMLTGIKIKLTPFVVLMMSMHRWFDCSAAVKVLELLCFLGFLAHVCSAGSGLQAHQELSGRVASDNQVVQKALASRL